MRLVLDQPLFLLLMLPLALLAFPRVSAAFPYNLDEKPKSLPHRFLHPARLWRLILLLAALCLVLAICDPALLQQGKNVQAAPGELLFILDLSGSMQAIDPEAEMDDPNSLPAAKLPPTRLQLAKQSIAVLLAKQLDCKAGLLVFAGECFLVCPPSRYHNILLERLHSLQSDHFVDGTITATALQAAQEIWQNSGGTTERSIILISDGADHGDINPAETAQELARHGITIHCLGIGGENGLHQVNTDTGQRWQAIAENLDAACLQEIAGSGGGRYFHVSQTAEMLPVLKSINHELTPQFAEAYHTTHKSLMPHCIVAALLLCALSAKMHQKHTLLQTRK